MASIDILTASGAKAGSIELDDEVFGIEPNVPVMHQVVTAQLNARRAGTQSTKTRAEVRGGGAKPWRQKGTGRARAGSSNVPAWRGGGVAMGPKPRSYAERTPKKMKRLALRSALSDRAAEGNVLVVDSWGFDGPSTKTAVAALAAIGAEGRVLVVVTRDNDAARKSFRNLPNVHVCTRAELNTYDIMVADKVVFTSDVVPTAEHLSTRKKGAAWAPAVEEAAAAAGADTEPEIVPAASADEKPSAGTADTEPAVTADSAAYQPSAAAAADNEEE